MGIDATSKLFLEVTNLFKKKEINLSNEIENLKIIRGSIEFTIDTINIFYNKYLSSKKIDQIENDIDGFVEEYIKLFAVIHTCSFIIKQAYLGKFILVSIESISSDLKKLRDAILFEASSNIYKLNEKLKGSDIDFQKTATSIKTNLGILELQKKYLHSLLESNENRTNSN
jgi:hypothetical protein